MSHLKTFFSRQATKAWVAGLASVIVAYASPYIASLTPKQTAEWLSSLGFDLPLAVVTALFGFGAAVWTYAVKNQK